MAFYHSFLGVNYISNEMVTSVFSAYISQNKLLTEGQMENWHWDSDVRSTWCSLPSEPHLSHRQPCLWSLTDWQGFSLENCHRTGTCIDQQQNKTDAEQSHFPPEYLHTVKCLWAEITDGQWRQRKHVTETLQFEKSFTLKGFAFKEENTKRPLAVWNDFNCSRNCPSLWATKPRKQFKSDWHDNTPTAAIIYTY